MGLRRIFSSRLSLAMREQGLSNSALARAAKVTEGTVRQALSMDGASPKLDTVEKLAKGLGVEPAWLLGVDDASLNLDLLQALVELLLEPLEEHPQARRALAEELLHTYEDARAQSIDSQNHRDLRLLTASSTRRLSSLGARRKKTAGP